MSNTSSSNKVTVPEAKVLLTVSNLRLPMSLACRLLTVTTET